MREWRRRAAAGAVITGVSLGMRDALGRTDEGPEVVVEERDPAGGELDRITVYFHPEVPEATLVLVLTGSDEQRLAQ